MLRLFFLFDFSICAHLKFYKFYNVLRAFARICGITYPVFDSAFGDPEIIGHLLLRHAGCGEDFFDGNVGLRSARVQCPRAGQLINLNTQATYI